MKRFGGTADYKKYLQFLEDQQIEGNKKVVDEILCAGFIDNFLCTVVRGVKNQTIVIKSQSK